MSNMQMHMKSPQYTLLWSDLFSSLSSTLSLNIIMTSFISHLHPVDALDTSDLTRATILSQALLIRGIFGKPGKDRSEIWDAIQAVTLGREWSVGHARIFACWISGTEKTHNDLLGTLLEDRPHE